MFHCSEFGGVHVYFSVLDHKSNILYFSSVKDTLFFPHFCPVLG